MTGLLVTAAAVLAGLSAGFRAPRVSSPRNRLSDSQNWRTVELLEGAVTVTAAQTLPANTPQRSVLTLIAFAVASLLL